jgi:hypothetical protein
LLLAGDNDNQLRWWATGSAAGALLGAVIGVVAARSSHLDERIDFELPQVEDVLGKTFAIAWRPVSIGLFTALIAYEWSRWPDSSAWIGPLVLLRFMNQPWVLDWRCPPVAAGLLFLMVCSFPLQPGARGAFASATGLFIWYAIGVAAESLK